MLLLCALGTQCLTADRIVQSFAPTPPHARQYARASWHSWPLTASPLFCPCHRLFPLIYPPPALADPPPTPCLHVLPPQAC